MSQSKLPQVEVAVHMEKGQHEKLPLALVRRTVRQVISHLGYLPAASVSVVLAGEETLAGLNNRFRGIPRATDVLSFPSGERDPDTGRIHLGDLVLSMPRVAEQARRAGHSREREASILLAHGTLHLFGFDHNTPARKRIMWAEQDLILKEIITNPPPFRRKKRR